MLAVLPLLLALRGAAAADFLSGARARGGNVSLAPACTPPKSETQGTRTTWTISSSCLLTCASTNCKYAYDEVVVLGGSTLTFDETRDSIELSARLLEVSGSLVVGTADRPYASQLNIVLTGTNADQDDDQVPKIDFEHLSYSKVLITRAGSNLSLHGKPKTPWLKLAKTAAAGASVLELVEGPHGWAVGDRVVVPSTGIVFGDETETVTVKGITGTSLTIDPPLKYDHYAGYADSRLNGEVGILSRNIRILGDVSDADHDTCLGMLAGDFNSYTTMQAIRSHCYGGHTVLLQGSMVALADVEMSRMGQATRLARYPVHFHLAGPSQGRVTNLSIWETYQRCVTVHGTWGVGVSGVVCHYTHGHAFYLEDGIEFDNSLVGNLAVKVRKGPMVCTDAGANAGPSAFWITNPNNSFVGNQAVDVWGGGDAGVGFWIISSGDPDVTSANYLSSAYWTSEFAAQSAGAVSSFGPSYTRFQKDASLPKWILRQQQARTPLKEFRNNGVRSSYKGMHIDGYVSSSVPGSLGKETHPEEGVSVFGDRDGTCNYFEHGDRPISYAEGMRAYMPVTFTYDADGEPIDFAPAYAVIDGFHVSRCNEAWWSRAGRLNITNSLFVSNWIGLTNHYPAGNWCPGDGIPSNPGLANLIVDSLFIGHEASFEDQLCKYGSSLAVSQETPSGIRQYDGGFWLLNSRWMGMDAVDCGGPDASVASLPYAMVSSRFEDCNYKVPTQLHHSWPLGAHPQDKTGQWAWALPADGELPAQSLVSFKGQSMCGFATGGVADMTGTLDPVNPGEPAGYYAGPIQQVPASQRAAQALYLRTAVELYQDAEYHNNAISSTSGALVPSEGWYFEAMPNPDYAHTCSYCDYTTGSSCPSGPAPRPSPTPAPTEPAEPTPAPTPAPLEPTPAPTPAPVPTDPTPAPTPSSSSWLPTACGSTPSEELFAAEDTVLTGVEIQKVGGLKICQDCANRCWNQMPSCVGVVFESYDNGNSQGDCTFFSSITGASQQPGASAITTAQFIPQSVTPTPAPTMMPAPTPAPTMTPAPTPSPTPAPPAHTPAPTFPTEPTPAPTPSSSSWLPEPCSFTPSEELFAAEETMLAGDELRTDGGVKLCQDCANRCWNQMPTCVGFVFLGYGMPSGDGKCTYYSSIASASEKAGATAVTTKKFIPPSPTPVAASAGLRGR